MTESEKKDMILEFFNQESNHPGWYQLYDLKELVFKDIPIGLQEITGLVEEIASEGYLLLKNSKCQYEYKLTPFKESGGYTKREEERAAALKKERDREERNEAMDKLKLTLTTWQVKAFWPVFTFTVIGSILGIISFLMQLAK